MGKREVQILLDLAEIAYRVRRFQFKDYGREIACEHYVLCAENCQYSLEAP